MVERRPGKVYHIFDADAGDEHYFDVANAMEV